MLDSSSFFFRMDGNAPRKRKRTWSHAQEGSATNQQDENRHRRKQTRVDDEEKLYPPYEHRDIDTYFEKKPHVLNILSPASSVKDAEGMSVDEYSSSSGDESEGGWDDLEDWEGFAKSSIEHKGDVQQNERSIQEDDAIELGRSVVLSTPRQLGHSLFDMGTCKMHPFVVFVCIYTDVCAREQVM